MTILAFDAIIGALFMPLGLIAVWQGAVLMLVIGLLGGFMQVSVFTGSSTGSRPPCWAAR
jgi:hypothetical protein